MYLNFLNSDIQNIEIRRALSMAIKRDENVTLLGFGQQVQRTPISRYYQDYYDDSNSSSFDYAEARDVFRANGLRAKDTRDEV